MINKTHQQSVSQMTTDPTPPPPVRWWSSWAVRGYLSTLGQSLQMVSSIKTTSGSPSDRQALFGYTFVNLLANAINIIFGAQQKDDPHRLRYLKEQINAGLAPLKRADATLPDAGQTLTKTARDDTVGGYLRQYSVVISEFALRTVGSLSLIAPITGWGKAAGNLRRGMSVGETFLLARNKNPVTFGAGWFSLAGKGFILAAQEPDPYSPEPPSLWRRAREALMFRASSLSEAVGLAWMAHDRFANQKVMIGGALKPDYFGGYGNVSVLAGYVPRWVAPYGTREVNMPELYAHIAEGLRALPDDQREPAKQRIVAELAEHFQEKKLSALSIRNEIDHSLQSAATRKPSSRIHTDEASHSDLRVDGHSQEQDSSQQPTR